MEAIVAAGHAEDGPREVVEANGETEQAHDAAREGEPHIFDFLEDEFEIDLTPSIFIAGILHCLSNITKGFDTVLLYWAPFIEPLRHVCRLLSRRYSRERMMEHCFSSGPQAALRDEFLGFSADVYEGPSSADQLTA